MTDPERTPRGLGDDQGTSIGSPNAGRAKETPLNAGATDDTDKADRAKQAPNAGRTRGEQESESTGAGSEAIEGINSNDGGHDREHRSGYGGSGGKPVKSSDNRP